MSDILIRGMEMPKSCDECRLFNECWCMALGIENWRKSYNKPPEGERLPDCPLVPLPEGHGDLIDRDNVLLDIDCTGTNKFGMLDEDIRAFLRRYKPIVPAEGGGEDG